MQELVRVVLMGDDQHRTAQRVLVLGTGMFSLALVNEVLSHPECRMSIIGLVAEHNTDFIQTLIVPVLGEIRDLRTIIMRHKPDRIFVTLDHDIVARYCNALLDEKYFRHIQVDNGQEFYEQLTGKLAIDTLTQQALILSNDFQPKAYNVYLSRVMSIVCAVIGLVVLAPLMLLIAAIIKLDSPGPVLFIQQRVGMGNTTFNLLKFRTMSVATGKTSEWVCDNTARITRSGRILRKFRLDELPQFINILRNEMNIVGPRPHPASCYELYALVSRNTPENGDQIPYYHLRSLVRPGITGWAQIRYRYANNLSEEIEKLRFDLYYIKHYSLWLDMKIMLETVKVVVLGREQRH